jgi:hypothetical protein
VHPYRVGDDPCRRIAATLTRAVNGVCDSLRCDPSATLALSRRRFRVGTRPMPKVADAKAAWENSGIQNVQEGLDRYWYWLAQRYENEAGYDFEFRSVSLGNALLLHFPGEPFVEMAQAIRAAAPGKKVLILANPCPEVRYLPSAEQREEGGDEPQFAPLHHDSEAQIRREAVQLVATGT